MDGDLIVKAIIPLVVALIQVVKGHLSEAVRAKYTGLIAMGCGVACLALWQMANGSLAATGQAIAALLLNGMATGLGAVGLYHVLGDLKPKE